MHCRLAVVQGAELVGVAARVCQGGRRGLPPPLRRGDGNECVSALSASFFDFDMHCLTMVRLAVAQGAEPEEGGRWRSLETPAGRLRCGFAGRGQDGRIRRGIPPAKSKRRPTERAASSWGAAHGRREKKVQSRMVMAIASVCHVFDFMFRHSDINVNTPLPATRQV